MSLLAFTTDSTDLSLAYHGHHTSMLVLLSLLIAILAAYFTLYVVAADVQRPLAIVRGGALMGAGIGCMHYLGMAAMVMQAERLYQPLLETVRLHLPAGSASLGTG